MVFGKCPFESKSISKLIKMLEEEDVMIPDNPKISPTLDKLFRRILVKNYNNRLDWKEMFQYTITETGEIYPPGVIPGSNPQFGLKQSIRTSNYGPNTLNFTNNNGRYSSNPNINYFPNSNNPINDSMKSLPVSPKLNKES